MSFMIPDLVQYFLSQIIVNRVNRVFKFFSRCSEFEQVPAKKNHDFELSKRQFSFTNKNNDYGNVSRVEVELIMGKLGIFCHPEAEKLQERLNSADLFNLFEEKEPSLDEVKRAFDVFDENRDGFIDAGELQRVLCALGLKDRAEIDSCRRMIRVFDENDDGRIDFGEFVKFMESSFC